jgi:hypothetical protein
MKTIFAVLISFFCATSVHAYGGGSGHSIEIGVGLATATQDDINSWITTVGGQQLSSGYEFSFTYLYRFSGSIYGIAFRPGYLSLSNSGTGSATMTGMTFMPIIRFYPLENNFIKFFMQIGMGFGTLSGKLSNGGQSSDFTGSAFGGQVGLGADFCFTDSNCMTIEGGFRYLPIARSTTTNCTGALGGGMTCGNELERNSLDAQNSLSGIQGMLAYTLKF